MDMTLDPPGRTRSFTIKRQGRARAWRATRARSPASRKNRAVATRRFAATAFNRRNPQPELRLASNRQRKKTATSKHREPHHSIGCDSVDANTKPPLLVVTW